MHKPCLHTQGLCAAFLACELPQKRSTAVRLSVVSTGGLRRQWRTKQGLHRSDAWRWQAEAGWHQQTGTNREKPGLTQH
jgi:hypothetical protein